MSDQVEYTFTLSSMPPLTSLLGMGTATLLVGVEEQEDGSVKAYVGARWKGIYLHVDGEMAEQFKRAWGSTMGHLWLSPLPPTELLCQDPK